MTAGLELRIAFSDGESEALNAQYSRRNSIQPLRALRIQRALCIRTYACLTTAALCYAFFFGTRTPAIAIIAHIPSATHITRPPTPSRCHPPQHPHHTHVHLTPPTPTPNAANAYLKLCTLPLELPHINIPDTRTPWLHHHHHHHQHHQHPHPPPSTSTSTTITNSGRLHHQQCPPLLPVTAIAPECLTDSRHFHTVLELKPPAIQDQDSTNTPELSNTIQYLHPSPPPPPQPQQ